MPKLLRALLPLSIAAATVAAVAGRDLISAPDDAVAPPAAESIGPQAPAPFSLRAAWREIGQKPAAVRQQDVTSQPGADVRSVAGPLRRGTVMTETAALQLRAAAEASLQDSAAEPATSSKTLTTADAAASSATSIVAQQGAVAATSVQPTDREPTPESQDEPAPDAKFQVSDPQPSATADASPQSDRLSSDAAPTPAADNLGAVSQTATSALRDDPSADAAASAVKDADDAEPPLPVRKTISGTPRSQPRQARHRAVHSQASRREARLQAAPVPASPSLRRVFRDLDYSNP